MKKRMTLLAFVLVSGMTTVHADTEWLSYTSEDIDVIDDAVAFGAGPDLILQTDDLEGAQIHYGNPSIIEFADNSALTLKRYTQEDFENEYGKLIGQSGEQNDAINVADIPAIMLNYNTKPSTMDYDNKELVRALQEAGARLVKPMVADSERFFSQRYTKRLWFVLGENESIGFLTDARNEDQFVMVRGQNMPKSEFLARVVRGALQPQGSEWESEERDIPRQHMVPLPK